jgi:uracil-DNA glycosylase
MKVEDNRIVCTIERLFKDRYASLRNYEVEEARKRGLPLYIYLKDKEDEYTKVPIEDLDKGVLGTVEFDSQFGSKYKLVDFPWIPTSDEKEKKKHRRIDMMGKDWHDLLHNEFERDYMKDLNKFLMERRSQVPVYPETREMFNALKLTPYKEVKVVIIGQDPYHTTHSQDKERGIAHGLAFSSCDPATLPPSLVNIFKEIEEDVQFGLYLKEDYNLTYWAEQGVLLLNTILTSEKGKALAHENKGWEVFTDAVVKALNRHQRRLVWMLWGNKAKSFRERRLIDTGYHLVLEAAHPAAEEYAKQRGSTAGFFGCKHFSKANEHLKKCGYGEINW